MIKKGHVFQSKKNNIELKLKKLDEPNYGRLLWRFDFKVNKQILKNSFIGEYSGLLADLENYIFESHNGDYIFLPLESGFLLYNTIQNSFEKLPKNSVAPNNEFIGNYFTNSQLVINRKREIQIYDMITAHSLNISFPFGKYQIINSELKINNLYITYNDLEDYNIYTRKYCLKNMKFIE